MGVVLFCFSSFCDFYPKYGGEGDGGLQVPSLDLPLYTKWRYVNSGQFPKSAEHVWSNDHHYSLNCTINTLKIQEKEIQNTRRRSKNMTSIFSAQCIIKQLLDSAFVICRIIKVLARVISLSLQLIWRITLLSQKPHPIIVYILNMH